MKSELKPELKLELKPELKPELRLELRIELRLELRLMLYVSHQSIGYSRILESQNLEYYVSYILILSYIIIFFVYFLLRK